MGCLERYPMNEFGEPNMGNPSVRFDEGRERVGHWPVRLSTQPLSKTSHLDFQALRYFWFVVTMRTEKVWTL